MRTEEFVPPHSHDAECSLLGSLMTWNDAQDDLPSLKASDFYSEENAKVFAAIMTIFAMGRTADIVSVYEYMREAGETVELSYLSQLTNVALSRSSVKRHAEIIIERATRRAILQHCSDINDAAYSAVTTDALVERANNSLSSITEGRTSSDPVPISQLIPVQLRAIDDRAAAFLSGAPAGITTGLADLDRQLGGGFRPGELIIIAGRPSMGKTALATNIAVASAKAGYKDAFFSQEMTNDENMNRIISLESGVPLQALRTGDLKEEHWAAISKVVNGLGDLKLHIDDQREMRLHDIRSKARLIKRKHGLDMVVVDYLQLMQGEGENRTQVVGAFSRGLKALAGELGVVVVALSQLNRSLEARTNKRPVLSDLRESGDIEADADCVLMLYRDEVYNASSQDKGTAEIIVSKQRNGPIGTVYTCWKGETAAFSNLARGYVPTSTSPSTAPWD